METAAAMWPLAWARKSPKTGGIVITGHQLADPLRRGCGFLARCAIGVQSRD